MVANGPTICFARHFDISRLPPGKWIILKRDISIQGLKEEIAFGEKNGARFCLVEGDAGITDVLRVRCGIDLAVSVLPKIVPVAEVVPPNKEDKFILVEEVGLPEVNPDLAHETVVLSKVTVGP